MGLDGVELVLECEDEFGIRIPDEQASKVFTVGELHALILRLRAPAAEASKTDRLAAIATALRECGITDSNPDAGRPLASVVPPSKRRAFWRSLDAKLGQRLPALTMPSGGSAALIGMLALFLVAAAVSAPAGLIVLVVGLIVLGLTHRLIMWACPTFPKRWRTPAQIAERTSRPMDADEAWSRLVNVVSGQLAVPPEKVTPEARFVEDLKMS